MPEESPTPTATTTPTLPATATNLLALATPVSQKVQLKHINLWSGSIARQSDAPISPMPTVYNQRFSTEFSRKSESQLDVKVTFVWFGKSDYADNAMVEAKFTILYELADLHAHSDDQIVAFSKTNGVFNAWPYWREYLHSTCARIGIAPTTVPALTIVALIAAYIMHEATAAKSTGQAT